MTRRTLLVAAALIVATLTATAAPGTAAPITVGPVVVTIGPIQGGRLTAVGYAPDFEIGCSTTAFAAKLVIEVPTGSAVGVVESDCGVQSTTLPAGSCRSNLPPRTGFSCANTSADGTRRYASTGSSEPLRSFSFSELRGGIWFQVDGVGAGAG